MDKAGIFLEADVPASSLRIIDITPTERILSFFLLRTAVPSNSWLAQKARYTCQRSEKKELYFLHN